MNNCFAALALMLAGSSRQPVARHHRRDPRGLKSFDRFLVRSHSLKQSKGLAGTLLLCMALCVAAPVMARADAVGLVKDINQSIDSRSSNPTAFISAGGIVYFVATTEDFGAELWRTDGTETGTRMVKDINPGIRSSGVGQLVDFNGTLFFSADDGVHGEELWKSDGTEAGTVLFHDMVPGTVGSSPRPVVVDGALYFGAFSGNDGGLWKSDSTAAGTVQIATVSPEQHYTFVDRLTVVSGTLYFTAWEASGVALWKSDLTSAGTSLVKEFSWEDTVVYITDLFDVGGALFFTMYPISADVLGRTFLWRSDGTTTGTQLVEGPDGGANLGYSPKLTIVGDTLYFIADMATGRALWKISSADERAQLVKDNVLPSVTIIAPLELTSVGAILYFLAHDSDSHLTNLWKTDGTPEGTVIVEGVPQSVRERGIQLDGVGGTLYMTAYAADEWSKVQLWRMDDATQDAYLITEFASDRTSSDLLQMTEVGGKIYFGANDGMTGNELWVSDGTPTGTALVADINRNGSGHSKPDQLISANGILFFGALDAVVGRELWRSDGTDAGTTLVKDINPGSGDGLSEYRSDVTEMNGIIYFAAHNEEYGTELWRSDGTTEGTRLVKDMAPGFLHSYPHCLTVVGGVLYFVASDGISGHHTWKTDGTEAGTVPLGDIGHGSWDYGSCLIKAAEVLYGVGYTDNVGSTLVKIDQTSSQLVSVKNIGDFHSPGEFVAVGQALYFVAHDDVNGYELWKSDGTEAGTVIVKDVRPGPLGAGPGYLVAVGGTLFFTANDGVHGYELWRSDGTGTGTVMVKDINPGDATSHPTSLTVVNGMLYFAADDGMHGKELWRSDGTKAGTVMVSDLVPGLFSSSPDGLMDVNGRLYFFASNDSTTGRKLWRTNGSTSGTVLAGEIDAAVDESGQYRISHIPGYIFINAYDTDSGIELWAVAIDQSDEHGGGGSMSIYLLAMLVLWHFWSKSRAADYRAGVGYSGGGHPPII